MNSTDYVTRAYAHLYAAQDARRRYDETLTRALNVYGDRHTPTWRQIGLSPRVGCDECRMRGIDHTDAERLNHQTGNPIAGIYSDHFPDAIKAQLRAYAHLITEQTSFALANWRKARKRIHTFRRTAQPFRMLPDGRESYY